MKLAQVILSYPMMSFRTRITHSTPRKSTAIEWAILEAVETTKKFPEMQNISIGELFSDVLKISDINGLFKKHISTLMDIGALVHDSSLICEHVDLFQKRMGLLQTTENGVEMQHRGLLPGAERSDVQNFDLNVFSGEVKFAKDTKDFDTTASGINVCGEESLSNVKLPSLKISELLSKVMVSDKNDITWLTPSSNIQAIAEQPNKEGVFTRKIKWINKAHILSITNKGELSSNGMDEALISKTLDLLEENSKQDNLNHSRISKRDSINFDTDVDRIVLENEIPTTLGKIKKNSRVFICNKNLYSAHVNLSTNGEPGVLIDYGSNQYDCNYDEKSKLLKISLPTQNKYNELLDSTVFVSGQTPLKVNTINVSIGNNTRELTLPYIPKNNQFPITEFITPIVMEHASENMDLLNLLPLTHQYDLFNKQVEVLSDAKTSLVEKVRFLTQLQDSNKRFFSRSFLSPETENGILFHNWITGDLSTEQAWQQVNEMSNELFIRNNPDRMMAGVTKLLEHWNDRENIELFWKIIETVNRGYKMEAFMSSMEILEKLYTDKILEQMVSLFGNIPTNIKKTDYSEEMLLEMQKIYAKIKAKICSIGYSADLTQQDKHSIAYNNPKTLQELDSMLVDMRQLYSKFSAYLQKRNKSKFEIVSINYFLKDEFAEFNSMIKLLENISQWIKPYLGANYSGFKNIYVTDTCAIMHDSKMVQKFEKGASALVVPKKVLSELDHLKDSPVEATKKAAREAIRALNSCHGKKWYFEEGADISLLPIEYTMNSGKSISGDDMILAVALKFWSRNPILLVDDKNFSNKAYGEKIQYMTVAKFMVLNDKQV